MVSCSGGVGEAVKAEQVQQVQQVVEPVWQKPAKDRYLSPLS